MRKLLYLISIFILVFFFVGIGSVSAKVIHSQNGSVIIDKNEIVDDDLFIGSQVVTIDGTINGNVFIGAQTVKVNGVINGNLHVGAQIVDISGQIEGNVYAGGQNINVEGGKISGALLAGAQNVTLDPNSTVGESLLVGAAALSLNTTVGRSVYAGVEKLTIGENAKIGKDLYYAAGKNNVNIDKNALVTGVVHKSEQRQNINVEFPKEKLQTFGQSFKIFGSLVSFFGALIVGYILVRFYGKFLAEVSNIVAKSFWKSFGVGFLVTIAFIPGLIILMITLIGIPLAGLVIIFMTLFGYMSKFVVSFELGKWIANKLNWKLSSFLALALGLLVFYILKMIPIIGFFTGLTVFWLGLGSLTLVLFSKAK